IANGENAAGGNGITPAIADELLVAGIDGITLGNHVWDKKELISAIDNYTQMARPANFPEGAPGRGWFRLQSPGGHLLVVINIMGKVFMSTQLRCPFREFDRIFEEIRYITPNILVDFHAETTSEKEAFGWYVDGRASVV